MKPKTPKKPGPKPKGLCQAFSIQLYKPDSKIIRTLAAKSGISKGHIIRDLVNKGLLYGLCE